jgi:hypothetical protein
MNITSFEKQLYNSYLAISRSARGKPFTIRKDFTDIEPEKLHDLKRISSLLSKYPHIKSEDYFKAPFDLYPDVEFFDLKYFANMTGVTAYTNYRKKIETLPPDHEKQLEYIAESLKFIARFCLDNKIKLEQYTESQTGVTFDWMKHLKRHKISVFVLMEFPDVYDKIIKVPEDEREILLGEFGKYYLGYKTKYLSSEKAKILVKQGLEKVKKLVNVVEITET